MIKVYGIVNCDTVKKARKWLEEKGLVYEFHDYKKLGIDEAHLRVWCKQFGWEKVLNRAGQMWRKADEQMKSRVVDEDSAILFMLQVPTAIKRPVIEYDEGLLLGFDEVTYSKAFRAI